MITVVVVLPSLVLESGGTVAPTDVSMAIHNKVLAKSEATRQRPATLECCIEDHATEHGAHGGVSHLCNGNTEEIGFNPHRKRVVRRSDIVFVAAAICACVALLVWTVLG